MPATRRRLQLEQLETRETPALFGIPWMDGANLTLSFLPDGTQADGATSRLDSHLAKTTAVTQEVYQTEILRAFQQWISVSNLNIALVTDTGLPLGTDGSSQHDTRFGDVRVGARSLAFDAIAVTAPPGALAGTRGGDVLLNTFSTFTIGGTKRDLYTVMLQEAGHALGIGNSADPTSAMYDMYDGVHAGLTAGDVEEIQASYGVRQHDVFEGSGNNSMGSARSLSRPSGSSSTTTLVAKADLTTASDVDWFSFTTSSSNPNGYTVRLNASKFSLLSGKVSVFDGSGRLLGSATATGPGDDLSVRLSSVSSSTRYYVKVEKAPGTAFAVGAYELEFVHTTGASRVNASGSVRSRNDSGSNDTLDDATELDSPEGYIEHSRYEAFARFNNSTDVDFYEFRSQSVAFGVPNVMSLSVWATNGSVAPSLTVYDRNGRVVPTVVLDEGHGMTTVQMVSVASDRDYYVAVRQVAGGSNEYRLAINAHLTEATLKSELAGTLSQATQQVWKTMSVATTDLRYFTLDATSTQNAAGVRMTIYGIWGEVVGTLFARPGEKVSGTFLLPAGLYWVRMTAGTEDGSSLAPIDYLVCSRSLSDTIGVLLSDTTTSGTSTDSGTSGVTPPTTTEPTLSWGNSSGNTWLSSLYPTINPFTM